ncbi:hypothetical protein ONZ43_g3497 [Nemania bipapillata]|uniref:Uncharacterized protein n=1 Tax=Nemania bipapillata TaxID=110536 RepID=A0ACC2IWS3_9PEZI|nr:hypothetical protein ONZ43_g3497 [Nemania bipapillata]
MWLINARSLQLKEFIGEKPSYAILSHTWGEEEVTFQEMADIEGLSKKRKRKLELTCRQAIKDGIKWELLAPRDMVFYDSRWVMIGDKIALSSILSDVTGIKRGYIDTSLPLSMATVAEKMSWAASRKTTREEDRSYSLLGIFGVNMPLLYGEGGHGAFLRLQKEVLNNNYDSTIFGSDLGLSRILTLTDDIKPASDPDPYENLRLKDDEIDPEMFRPQDLFASVVSNFDGSKLEMNPDWPHLAETSPTFEGGMLRVTVPITTHFVPEFAEHPAAVALFGFRWQGISNQHSLFASRYQIWNT